MQHFNVALVLVMLLLSPGCIREAYRPVEVLGKENNSKYRVRIRFFSPAAKSVYVAGTFNNWTVPRIGDDAKDMQYLPVYKMKPAGNRGEWELEFELPPGMQQYRFFVDLSRWEIDERNHLTIRSMDGTAYNYLIVK